MNTSPRFQSVVVVLAAATILTSGGIFARDWRRAPKVASDMSVPGADTLAERGFSMGPARAPHTMIVFTDFACGYCRRYLTTIDSVLAQHPDLRVVERHLPNVNFPLSWDAAAAAECAGDQGKYAAMRGRLNQVTLGKDDWGRIAAAAGVPDTAALKRCMRSEHIADRIARDTTAGRPISAGTPTVVLDRWRFAAPPSAATVAARLAFEARK